MIMTECQDALDGWALTIDGRNAPASVTREVSTVGRGKMTAGKVAMAAVFMKWSAS